MKRKLLALEVYADDNNIEDSIKHINDLINEVGYHEFIQDGTVNIKIIENHIAMYRQLKRRGLI